MIINNIYSIFTLAWCMDLTILFLPLTWWYTLPNYKSKWRNRERVDTLDGNNYNQPPSLFLLTSCLFPPALDPSITGLSHLLSPPFRHGLITAAECAALNEMYNFNPLLFDFACKRLLRGQNKEAFPSTLFKQHPLLPPCREIGTGV